MYKQAGGQAGRIANCFYQAHTHICEFDMHFGIPSSNLNYHLNFFIEYNLIFDLNWTGLFQCSAVECTVLFTIIIQPIFLHYT